MRLSACFVDLCALFFHLFWTSFVACDYVDFVVFHLTIQSDSRTFFAYGLPELLSHSLDITDIQIKLLSDLSFDILSDIRCKQLTQILSG